MIAFLRLSANVDPRIQKHNYYFRVCLFTEAKVLTQNVELVMLAEEVHNGASFYHSMPNEETDILTEDSIPQRCESVHVPNV